ncbi:hypothetical protein E2C01_008291 [Portunus trituberculatus]|uniref:Uncharacterized protein n=1 Tax=Portunus trituberculatus TaxID=210409 RepID=A0A5B7D1D8_PORTR|nr:hypothetical protein [Portunus trituberculatus]
MVGVFVLPLYYYNGWVPYSMPLSAYTEHEDIGIRGEMNNMAEQRYTLHNKLSRTMHRRDKQPGAT